MKRLIVTAVVAGVLGASLFAPAVAQPRAQPAGGGVAAKPAPTIDTYVDWTGLYVHSFGRPNTTTYGQVITVPAHETDLVRFRFYLHKDAGKGHLILRGEVYQWDGQMATGPALWEGAQREIELTSGDHWRRVGFRVGGVDLLPGGEYVLFASISKDYERSSVDYKLKWASVPQRSYRSGRFVFINSGGHEEAWTTERWEDRLNYDLAFKAWFRPHA